MGQKRKKARLMEIMAIKMKPSVDHPQAPIQDISNPDERQRLDECAGLEVLWEFNDTFEAYSAVCVHDLVHAQAMRTPDADAVDWQGTRASFAGLMRWAEGVASWLQARDAAPDKAVALQLFPRVRPFQRAPSPAPPDPRK